VTGLEWVIRAKIAVTVVAWAGPMLLLPRDLLARAGPPAAYPLVRLLGWAYLTLVVGYAYGLREVRDGGRATGTVVMGVVSNGGVAALLTYLSVTGAWGEWHRIVQLGAFASALVAFAIAVGLWWFGLHDAGKPQMAPQAGRG